MTRNFIVDLTNSNEPTISSTNTNGNVIIDPHGTGKVDMSGAVVTNLADPVGSTDAVTLGYLTSTINDFAVNISDLDDVAITSGGAIATQILINDGSKWNNKTVTGAISITSGGVVSISDNAIALGTKTTGNYVATITGTADQISVSGSGSETASITLSLPQSIATTSSPTFADLTLTGTLKGPASMIIDPAGYGDNTGSLTIKGDLIVEGTTTTIDSTVVTVNDRVIVLANDSTSTNDGLDRGVQFKNGNGTSISVGFFGYSHSLNKFTFDIDGNGADVYIKGTLTADRIDGGTF